METERQKLKREIANIWYEINLDVQLTLFTFVVVAIGRFIYILLLERDAFTFLGMVWESLQLGFLFCAGVALTGIMFQLMSVITGSSFSYRGSIMARPGDIEKNVPRLKLYLQILIKIVKYWRS